MSEASVATGVATVRVEADDGDLRVDRWFRRHYPTLSHGRLEKLLRTGQVRVDGGRVKAGDRLAVGQIVRVPPLPAAELAAPKIRTTSEHLPTPAELRLGDDLRDAVVHRDKLLIALNKPAGLAVQGGSGTAVHVDGMLDYLRFEARERPRLVHRLDKDTSGLLLLGRTVAAAAKLADAFRQRDTIKEYWAIVVGAPPADSGRIDLALAKTVAGRHGGEQMVVDEKNGDRAVTDYEVADRAGRKLTLVVLRPVTGRTHQLRVHCAEMGTPILGDGKYGGAQAFEGMLEGAGGLHLHAARLTLPNPAGGMLKLYAEPSPHFRATMTSFGFDPPREGGGFR